MRDVHAQVACHVAHRGLQFHKRHSEQKRKEQNGVSQFKKRLTVKTLKVNDKLDPEE